MTAWRIYFYLTITVSDRENTHILQSKHAIYQFKERCRMWPLILNYCISWITLHEELLYGTIIDVSKPDSRVTGSLVVDKQGVFMSTIESTGLFERNQMYGLCAVLR